MQETGVIVGVDGCDACQAALRFAIDEAARRGCGLAVVVAYGQARASVPGEPGTGGGGRAAADVAWRCLKRAQRTGAPGRADCEIITKEMAPVNALAAAARNAIAIIVGRHHEEPAGGNSVGSTTNRLLEHSPIPVISVPRGYP